MLNITREISALVDMLPRAEQNLAYELVKRMVLAWDSDFTKLTNEERKRLELAELDFVNNETITHEEINWD